MTWKEFWARVAIAAVLTPVIHVVGEHVGRHVADPGAWVLAAVAALCLVFLGEFLWDAFTGDA